MPQTPCHEPPIPALQRTPPRRRPATLALAALLAFALGLLIYRGTIRGLDSQGSRDFAWVLSCTAGWVHALNPYDSSTLDAPWRAMQGPEDLLPSTRASSNNLYPPTTFALLSPLTKLTWDHARILWAILNTLMPLCIAWMLLAIAGLPLRSTPALIFFALCLAAAPVSTAISLGQLPLPVLAAVAAAHRLRLRAAAHPAPVNAVSLDSAAGVFLGLATALKPQIGMVFLAYELFRLRWRIVLPALFTLAALVAVGIGRLRAAGIDWYASLSANIRAFSSVGSPGDASTAAVTRSQLTNLHVPLHALIDNPATVTALVWIILGSFALLYLFLWLRRREDSRELLTLSFASCLLLLLVYHRTYDAVVLFIPVIWAIDRLRSDGVSLRQWPALLTLACASVFAAPGGAALALLERTGRVPPSLSDSTFYRLFLEGHQPLALLLMAAALLAALRMAPRAPAAWGTVSRERLKINPSWQEPP